MDSLILQILIASIGEVSDIKVECLKSNCDLKFIQDRAARIDERLNLIFNEIGSVINDSRRHVVGQREDIISTLKTGKARFTGLSNSERDALLECARQRLRPGSGRCLCKCAESLF